jgi:hypothetical protein
MIVSVPGLPTSATVTPEGIFLRISVPSGLPLMLKTWLSTHVLHSRGAPVVQIHKSATRCLYPDNSYSIDFNRRLFLVHVNRE